VTRWVNATIVEFYLMSLTNDAVLELLVLPDRVVTALALMFFTIEILNCLIVKQTVSVNCTRNLGPRFRKV
jgi:hypothetical protein